MHAHGTIFREHVIGGQVGVGLRGKMHGTTMFIGTRKVEI
jgi:hypothetical protein